MPTYTFENKETGEQQTHVMSLAEREVYLAEHPELIQLIISPNRTMDPTKLGRVKPNDEFREILRGIQKNFPDAKGINSY